MKIFSWLKESNRLSHMYVGFAIYVLGLLLAGIVLGCYNHTIDFTQSQADSMLVTTSVLSLFSVSASMCSVECIQTVSGVGKWDWLDVLAGVLVPVLLTVIITVLVIAL